MKHLIVAALLLTFASVCEAADVYRDKSTGNWLMLTSEPCALPAATLDHAKIRPAVVDDRGLRGAVLYYYGRTLKACYATKGGLVRALDEEGDNIGALPEVDFTDELVGPDGLPSTGKRGKQT